MTGSWSKVGASTLEARWELCRVLVERRPLSAIGKAGARQHAAPVRVTAYREIRLDLLITGAPGYSVFGYVVGNDC